MLMRPELPTLRRTKGARQNELPTRQNGSIDSVQNDRVRPQRSYEPHRETHPRHVELLGPVASAHVSKSAREEGPLCGPRLQDKLRATSRIDLRIGALRVGLLASQLARFL